MRHPHFITAAIAVGLGGCSDSISSPRVDLREFQWEGFVSRGSSLELKGINGGIRVQSGPGRDARIFATIRGNGHSADDVTVEVVRHAGGVTVCARYPLDGGGLTPCRPGAFGDLRLRSSRVTVEFTATIPEDVVFHARTINGSIRATDLGEDAFGFTVNGDVRIETQGLAEASTVNGSVWASMGRPQWSRDLRFTTVNGNVALSIPSETGAWVDGSTINGRISTDFGLSIRRAGNAESMHGTIGQGGGSLFLGTINGDVRLRGDN